MQTTLSTLPDRRTAAQTFRSGFPFPQEGRSEANAREARRGGWLFVNYFAGTLTAMNRFWP